MSGSEGITYWRPRVMCHTHGDGRIEYAIHEVFFSQADMVVTYTQHAVSDRKETVEELEAWVRSKLPEAHGGIACGDLGYTYHAEDLAMWLDHIGDPPLGFGYEEDPDAGGRHGVSAGSHDDEVHRIEPG